MKFKKNSRRKPSEYERDIVRYWKENAIFEESVSSRPKDNAYVFYDGPPFITGVPHHGTLLSSVVKDAIPRYWTMKGKRVERVWGWDCHGLPAEVFTEKKLGINDKRDIGTKISLEEYIRTCRDNMVQTGSLWEDTIDRIGRWVNFKGAYKTMDKEYMESVWWAFKQLYDKGKIYEGEKVLLYCTRDATPISKAEVAMDNSYQDVTDPSVYVKFKLKNYKQSLNTLGMDGVQGDDETRTESYRGTAKGVSESSTKQSAISSRASTSGTGQAAVTTYLLAWTTTPWTLNANTAIVIGKDIEYSEIENGGDVFIVASALINKVFTDEKHQPLEYSIIRTFKGEELVGLEYEPLFEHRGENAHKIWHADFVTDENGTGIAHQAPGYGEDDYIFAKANNVPFVLDTDEEGYYTEGQWTGQQIWEVNKQIAKDLKEQGIVWKIEYIRHEYPHCHRCGTKLQYRAHPSWFMDIDGQRTDMLAQNASINWFPDHIKHGRFEKTVESAPDWNLSRDRFWATAIPVWKAIDEKGEEHIEVIGSYAELKALSGVELEDYHRPWIDAVTFEKDGLVYKRIEKVMDCWFESGSMPFAQFHYPFENSEVFESNFPGDFISEYVGQVRAWFYYLHTVNVGLFEKNAFKNVIVTGSVMGSDGKKLSKSLGNYTDPNLVMDQYGADALRFTLLSSPVLAGEDMTLKDKDIGDVSRKLAMIWNMYDFFTLYADVDKWEFHGDLSDPSSHCRGVLDKWIISRLHQLNNEVDVSMQAYDVPRAVKGILPFVDDMSNWYIRRSRRRFWKSDDPEDKEQAYRTLLYCLSELARIMAPFTPFLSEELYRLLTGEKSVHLSDWKQVGHIDELLLRDMAKARRIIEDGLGLRMATSENETSVKVRQPLSRLTYSGAKLSEELEAIIAEEVNVKEVYCINSENQAVEVLIDKTLTPELVQEGLAREIIRRIQVIRKNAGFDVDDRILLTFDGSSELQNVLEVYREMISDETLAEYATSPVDDAYEAIERIEGAELILHVSKK